MADLSPLLKYDPSDFPQLAPLHELTRSLAVQPGRFFSRRAYPLRWLFSVPNGTGDLEALRSPRFASAISVPGGDTPIVCNDRVTAVNAFSLRTIAPLFFDPPPLTVDVTWERGGDRVARWTWLFEFDPGLYSARFVVEPADTQGDVQGEMNGEARLTPVPHFRDLR